MTSLRNKLWLGFGSLSAILVAVSVLSIVFLARYSHTLERVLRENYDSAVYSDGMKQSLDELNLRAQQMIWGEPAAPRLDAAGPQARFEQCLRAQLGNCNLPGELDATKRVAEGWEKYRAHYAAFENVPSGQRADRYRQDLLPYYNELKQEAQRITDMNVSTLVSVDGRATGTLLHVRNALLILVVAGIALAALVLWTATLTIFRPLKDLTRSARRIESGDLEHDLDLPTRSRDEIGTLIDAFNSMASRLREFKRIDHDRLIRTQQTTQLAIDSLPDPVFVIGPEGTVEISNVAARSHFGIEPGRDVATLGLKWLLPLYEEVKLHQKAVEPVAYRSAIQIFVNGEERFLLPKAVPMSSPDQRQVGVTTILVDVTRFRHMDEAKSGLVSTVSHELRTPLTSQRLVLGLLLETVASSLTASQRRLLEVAKADSDRLYRTIEDLLSISRIESGRAQFQFRPMSPHDIVHSAIDALRPLFADKNLSLTVSAPTDLPSVRADAPSICSALTNLISNALKFAPAGGRVAVIARNSDGRVSFAVTDSGPGVPEEFRSRLFEKFFRVPLSSGPTGAGLGLTITKQIIDAHDGGIEFTCPPEGGTVVQFWLPQEQQPADSASAMPPQQIQHHV
ncbi:MAG: multi-sensor signal transduction histidine kinase [Phycisphaerales bacterium]|nr:multi-sensor signal transduction histidine kinase [Phycisphaerales bacterium]